MRIPPMGPLALAICLTVLSSACNGSGENAGGGEAGNGGGTGAAGGMGGTGGGGGVGGEEAGVAAPGLWLGATSGLRVCLYVAEDGLRLTRNTACDLAGVLPAEERSYDLAVDAIGRDETGQPCSFDLGFVDDVPIDETTRAFGASALEPGTGAELRFSGEFYSGSNASGVAERSEGASTCTVGWEVSPAAPCDADAANACLNLQNCCEAILVNPTFFESCNSVVLECNQSRCQALLEGYGSRCSAFDI